ncbi:MAG: hypothetical protein K2O91_06225 [Lachnospiraceae bacterium]|nr:hypothetical protein [Lachnospiraceae bacterium]
MVKRVVIERELSDLEKAELIKEVLKLFLEKQLSINQITQILSEIKDETYKLPLTGFCSKSG